MNSMLSTDRQDARKNRAGFVVAMLLLFSANCFTGCGKQANPTPDPSEAIDRTDWPDRVILYAVDGPRMEGVGYDTGLGGEPYDPLADLTPDHVFHGYPIMGSIDLTETAEGADLAAILEIERDREQGPIAGCFTPRHAMRIVRDGKTTDYVICFECTQFNWHDDGQERRSGTQFLWDTHFDAFTAPLTEAGIDLAP